MYWPTDTVEYIKFWSNPSLNQPDELVDDAQVTLEPKHSIKLIYRLCSGINLHRNCHRKNINTVLYIQFFFSVFLFDIKTNRVNKKYRWFCRRQMSKRSRRQYFLCAKIRRKAEFKSRFRCGYGTTIYIACGPTVHTTNRHLAFTRLGIGR